MKRRCPWTPKQEQLLQDEPAVTKVVMQEVLCWAGQVQELILSVTCHEHAPTSLFHAPVAEPPSPQLALSGNNKQMQLPHHRYCSGFFLLLQPTSLKLKEQITVSL